MLDKGQLIIAQNTGRRELPARNYIRQRFSRKKPIPWNSYCDQKFSKYEKHI
jgi:hypothetical protein